MSDVYLCKRINEETGEATLVSKTDTKVVQAKGLVPGKYYDEKMKEVDAPPKSRPEPDEPTPQPHAPGPEAPPHEPASEPPPA